MKKILSLLIIALPFIAPAQDFKWTKMDSLFKFVQPVASIQSWAVYTMGEKSQLVENGNMEPVEDRLNFMVRRARIGFKGKPYTRISYTLSIQYDNLGKDKLGSIRGSTNTGQLAILDAFVTWRMTKNDLAHLTIGYLHPQFSRECITGDMNVNSFDKSPAQGYIRQNVNGKGYGRSTGVNIGGVTHAGIFTIGYNAGLFNNNTTAANNVTESAGKFWSPLLVERITFSIGDPDQKSYAINYDVNNYFNERKGITIGLNSASQQHTDIFSANYSIGYDVILNYKNLNVDVEQVNMLRRVEGITFRSRTRQFKVGYNMIVADKFFLEPMAMYVKFIGDTGAPYAGMEEMIDTGVNWYLNKRNLKLSLHYVFQNGHGDNGYTDGVTFEKGDFIGFGYVMIF